MDKFELVSQFKPQGDQPQAIQTLVDGIKKGERMPNFARCNRFWENFHYGKCHCTRNKPTIVLAHNKTLCPQLCSEFKEFFQITVLNFSCRITIIINQRHIFRQTNTFPSRKFTDQ